MGVQAVVQANGQSKEVSQISTPHSLKTAKPILMKLETYNYCPKTTHHASCRYILA